jgi:hypothetical protein
MGVPMDPWVGCDGRARAKDSRLPITTSWLKYAVAFIQTRAIARLRDCAVAMAILCNRIERLSMGGIKAQTSLF